MGAHCELESKEACQRPMIRADTQTHLYFPDGGKLVYDSLARADEPADPMTDWIVSQGRPLDRDEIIKLVGERDAYRMEVAHHWQDAGIDCLLSPVGPTPAPQPFTAKYWNVSCPFYVKTDNSTPRTGTWPTTPLACSRLALKWTSRT